jgi:hypothetical protein
MFFHYYPDPAKDQYGWRFDRLAELLENAIESITHGRDEVILFVGSARQSARADRNNAQISGNGSCQEAYEILASQRGWKLNKALLDDYGATLLESSGHDFHWFLDRADKSGTRWGANPKEHDTLPKYQEHLKRLIATNAVAQLMKTNPHDQVDLYFFDDRRELLEAAAGVKTPDNIRLHTVWFDHYGFYSGDIGKSRSEKHSIFPMPEQDHLRAIGPDGCAEDLSTRTERAKVKVKARMERLSKHAMRNHREA